MLSPFDSLPFTIYSWLMFGEAAIAIFLSFYSLFQETRMWAIGIRGCVWAKEFILPVMAWSWLAIQLNKRITGSRSRC